MSLGIVKRYEVFWMVEINLLFFVEFSRKKEYDDIRMIS